MSKYRIDRLQPESLDSIVSLRLRVFGGSKRATRHYLKWKYLDNPYLHSPLVYVARVDGHVVGMRGWFGTAWSVPGLTNPQVLPCAAESAIDPAYRDQGIFADLTDFAMEELKNLGFDYAINMSATPANYVTSILAMRWRSIERYRPLIRQAGNANAVHTGRRSKLKKSVIRHLLERGSSHVRIVGRKAIGNYRQAAFDKRLNHNNSISVSYEPNSVAMARIAQQHDDRTRIRHLRDDTYFRWRYSNPLSIYRFVSSRCENPEAIVVLQCEGGLVIRIVDWVGDEEKILTLINDVVAASSTIGVSTWANSISETMDERLRLLGFHDDTAEGRRGFLIRSLATKSEGWQLGQLQVLDDANWDLRMIFSDRF